MCVKTKRERLVLFGGLATCHPAPKGSLPKRVIANLITLCYVIVSKNLFFKGFSIKCNNSPCIQIMCMVKNVIVKSMCL